MGRTNRRTNGSGARAARALAAAGVLVLALGLAACPIDTGPGAPLALSGMYVHEGSGISFPETAAGFERVKPRRYDAKGDDVGIGYRRTWDGIRAEVTVYVFPSPRRADGTAWPFEDEFAQEVNELRDANDGPREVRRTDTSAAFAGRPVAVRTAEFEFRTGPGFGSDKVTSILTAFDDAPWHVTYRVSAASAHRDTALAAVETFLTEMKLPPMGLPAEAPEER